MSVADRVWDKTKPPPAPLPPPEQPWTRVAETDCRPATLLASKARATGWTVDIWTARGPFMGADGEDLGTADGVALVLRWADEIEAVAGYYWRGKVTEKGARTWESSGVIAHPHVAVTITDLTHWLVGSEPKAKPVEDKSATHVAERCPCGCGALLKWTKKKGAAA